MAHKKYLNDWFTGKWPGSPARGELYNDDPRLGDARLCGTTASLCGLESAQTPEETALALACDVMLHAWMLTQSGIPVLYSGDEIGQLNDHSYHLTQKNAQTAATSTVEILTGKRQRFGSISPPIRADFLRP